MANQQVRDFLSLNDLLRNRTETIFDYRDFQGASCLSEDRFFIDLEDYQEDFSDFTLGSLPAPVINSSVSVSTYWTSRYNVNGEVVRLGQGETFDGFTANLYDSNSGGKKVCADHVGASPNNYSTRRYDLIGDFNYILNVKLGEVEYDVTKSCPAASIGSVSVRTRPINNSNPDDVCEPVTLAMVNEASSNLLQDCDRVNLRNICPEDLEIELGPSEGVLLDLYTEGGGLLPPGIIDLPNTEFQWTPSVGLNNASIVNPLTSYSAVPSDPYSFFRYHLDIDYFDGTEARYCEILYKCNSCGAIEDPLPPIFSGLGF